MSDRHGNVPGMDKSLHGLRHVSPPRRAETTSAVKSAMVHQVTSGLPLVRRLEDDQT